MIIFLRYENSGAVLKALKTMLTETFDPAETNALAEKHGRNPW